MSNSTLLVHRKWCLIFQAVLIYLLAINKIIKCLIFFFLCSLFYYWIFLEFIFSLLPCLLNFFYFNSHCIFILLFFFSVTYFVFSFLVFALCYFSSICHSKLFYLLSFSHHRLMSSKLGNRSTPCSSSSHPMV